MEQSGGGVYIHHPTIIDIGRNAELHTVRMIACSKMVTS